MGAHKKARERKHKDITTSPSSDYKGYQREYYQKRTKPLRFDSYLAGARAIAPPKKKKGEEWSF